MLSDTLIEFSFVGGGDGDIVGAGVGGAEGIALGLSDGAYEGTGVGDALGAHVSNLDQTLPSKRLGVKKKSSSVLSFGIIPIPEKIS